MSIFKNENESAYIGGRKHWTDVIKNSGDADCLLWRQPEEDFNNNSTLIVMPGEEAIFINGGTIEKVFTSGTYKLSTNNYPFISRLKNAFSGGVSTFNCVVYFVRKSVTAELKWGTDSPIMVRDKKLGIATSLRARGAYKVKVFDSQLFLSNLAGNRINRYVAEDVNRYFSMEFQSKIKSTISKVLQSMDTELLGIDSRLDELSYMIEPYIDQVVSEYGLNCVKFSISGLDIDNDTLRRKYDEIGMNVYEKERMSEAERYASYQQAEAAKTAKILDSEANKEVMKTLGDDWGKQQSAEILKAIANNPGAGGMAAAGAGIGMGMGAANVIAAMANEMLQPVTSRSEGNNPVQHSRSGRFTQKNPETQSNNSQPAAPIGSNTDPVASLRTAKQLLDEGLITQEEYDKKKAEILSRM